jgi:uncharacterized protein (DUF302 family)
MKRKMMHRAAVILTLSATLLAGCEMGSMMIQEKKSPYGYEQTIATLQENAKARGWIVPKVYDFQRSLLANDQPDPGRVTVLKLCHPKFAGRMLEKDASKFVSVMMPCSVSVYEKDDGKTYVAAMNMNLMSRVMGVEVGSILKQVAAEDEAILGFLGNDD